MYSGYKLELNKFALSQNTLDGDAIMSNWFPKIQADIFISHSHADEKYVITLAGFLNEKFGLRSFIDSCVWGYSVELLKEIDNRFCSTGRPGRYSCEKQGYTGIQYKECEWRNSFNPGFTMTLF